MMDTSVLVTAAQNVVGITSVVFLVYLAVDLGRWARMALGGGGAGSYDSGGFSSDDGFGAAYEAIVARDWDEAATENAMRADAEFWNGDDLDDHDPHGKFGPATE